MINELWSRVKATKRQKERRSLVLASKGTKRGELRCLTKVIYFYHKLTRWREAFIRKRFSVKCRWRRWATTRRWWSSRFSGRILIKSVPTKSIWQASWPHAALFRFTTHSLMDKAQRARTRESAPLREGESKGGPFACQWKLANWDPFFGAFQSHWYLSEERVNRQFTLKAFIAATRLFLLWCNITTRSGYWEWWTSKQEQCEWTVRWTGKMEEKRGRQPRRRNGWCPSLLVGQAREYPQTGPTLPLQEMLQISLEISD